MRKQSREPLSIAVLASGHGSTLQAIIDRIECGDLEARLALVVSDVPDAYALDRARAAAVPVRVVAPADFPDREAWNKALAAVLAASRVELVVLAGFMRIVGPQLLRAFPGSVLNIHPSLLPKYRGLNTYRRALAAGDREHGSSVHFVTEELDGGPVIAQVHVETGRDDEVSLRTRVQCQERWLYPEVIGWFAEGRVAMRGESVWLDGQKLEEPVHFEAREAYSA